MNVYQLFIEAVNTHEVTILSAGIRLVLSLLLGACIGFERQLRKRDAGMRTFTLMCMGSCLAMLVSIWIPQTFPNFLNGDPGRISAQVISGVGFLGAGAIIHGGGSIQGLTTAACIWIIAVIGLAIGAGLFIPAIGATALALFVLVSLEHVEKKMYLTGVNKNLVICCNTSHPNDDKIKELLEEAHITVLAQSFVFDYENEKSTLTYKVNVRARYAYAKLFAKVNELGYVGRIELLT